MADREHEPATEHEGLVALLEAGANSIAIDGTPSQVGPSADELHRAATAIQTAIRALATAKMAFGIPNTSEETKRHALEEIDKALRAMDALASLKQPGGV